MGSPPVDQHDHGEELGCYWFGDPALDESNVRKAFSQVLDKAELHRRGPHQMRHTFASLLLQAGEPITYVSGQMRHKDPAITLRVYAHRIQTASYGIRCTTLHIG